jgi:uncharacterized protein YjdB/beta-glucanase (GH16 family)
MICGFILIIFSGKSAISQHYPHTDPYNSGNWVLNEDVSDEFNDTILDAGKWFVPGTNGDYRNRWKGRAPSQYAASNVTVDSGYLTITTRWDPGFEFADESLDGYKYGEPAPVTTGCLITEKSFLYGYMEIRCRAADGPVASAFWSTGNGGELDVFEHYGHHPNKPEIGRKYHTSFHDWRNGSPDFGQRVWTNEHYLDYRVAGGFHVYGFEWAENYVKIYTNGRLIRCVQREEVGEGWVVVNPQQIWLDCELFNWHVKPEVLEPSDFPDGGRKYTVDYVRVWQRNEEGTDCREGENLITNGGLELNLDGWTASGAARQVYIDTYEGIGAVKLDGLGSIEQTVAVKPGTDYILSARIMLPGTNMSDVWHNAYLGVRNYGGPEVSVQYFRPEYTYQSIQFRTGDVQSMKVYYRNINVNHKSLGDEFIMAEAVDLRQQEVKIPLTGLDLLEDSVSSFVSGTISLTALSSPPDATDRRLAWRSADSAVAGVNEAGLVVARDTGNTVIRVSSFDGLFTDSCHLSVVENKNLVLDPGFESGELSPFWSDSYGYSGIGSDDVHSGQFAGQLLGNGAVQKVMADLEPGTTYTLSCWGKVAEEGHTVYLGVSEFGGETSYVNALFTGTSWVRKGFDFTTGSSATSAKIWFWNGDLYHRAFCDDFVLIKASDTIPLTGVNLSPNELTLPVGGEKMLRAGIIPANATYRTLSWTSEHDSVATVGNDGRVRAVSPGTTTVTVRSDENGAIFSNASVTVPENSFIRVNQITVTPSEITMKTGGTAILSATVLPDSAGDKSLAWTSGDESIILVNREGAIRAIGTGTATVTARSLENDTVAATALITVGIDTVHVTGISVMVSDPTVHSGSLSRLMEVNIHPNPYPGGDLKLTLDKVSDVSLNILDITGKTIFRNVYHGTSLIILNREQHRLKNGLYMITCQSGDRSCVKKLIVGYRR